MALLLKQTTDKGITASYHRISNIEIDFNTGELNIYVSSYSSSEYRDQEKDFNKSLSELKQKRELLDQLIQNASDENEADRIKLTTEINENPLAMTSDDAIKELKVYDRKYIADVSKISGDDFGRDNIYKYLMTLPEFSGAESV